MADDRTPEQRKADEALEEAIKQSVLAYADDEDRGWVLTDYIVMTATTNLDGLTSYQRFFMGNQMAWYRIFGLVELNRKMLQHLLDHGCE